MSNTWGCSIWTNSNNLTIPASGSMQDISSIILADWNNIYLRNSVAGTTNVANFSVREIAGNHARQTTSTARPTLTARVNQFTETEFRNGVSDAPTRTGLVTATTLSGYAGALAFWHDGSATSYAYKTSFTTVVGLTYTMSVVVEMTDGLAPVFGAGTASSTLNDFAFVIGNIAVNPPSGYIVESLGSSMFRVSATSTATVISANSWIIKYSTNSNRTFKVTAYSIVSSNQVNLPYQRVNTATDYNTVGFPIGIRTDWIDDFLITNSIDFSGTDKMTVFAGARLLSSTGLQILLETSTSYAANNWAFELSLNEVYAGAYALAYKSPWTTQYMIPLSATIPRSSVFSGQMDGTIHPNVGGIKMRENGAVITWATSSVHTATTFGDYPLYIGRRGGASAPFSGIIYQMIIRWSISTDKQITETEKIINSKTKAY